MDEDEKIRAKRLRNDLIQCLLTEGKLTSDVTMFLKCFKSHYVEWQTGELFKKPRKRF
jgi:hypothetical protein